MSKTPVSMLQEHLMRQGSMPLYKLVYDQGGTHLNLFKYQVSVGDLSAIGSGSSKKEAKHDAARTLLERLQIPVDEAYHPAKKIVKDATEDVQYCDVSNGATSEVDDTTDFTSPASNSIGKLNEALRANSLPQAEFDLTGEEGPPHEKLFTITCTVSKLKESATARTKKLAKHLAAEKMVARLLKTMPDVLTPKQKPQAQDLPSYEQHNLMTEAATAAYLEVKKTKKTSANPSLISGCHLALVGQLSDTLAQVSEHGAKYLHDVGNATLLQLLESATAELDMTHEFVANPFGRQFLPQEGYVIMALRLKGIHEDTVIGTGFTEDEARKNLLCQAFSFLETMTHL